MLSTKPRSSTSVTEFWVCMGLTVYNSSKSEGSMMYDNAFFLCIFLHFLANITRMATTPPPRWGTSPRWTRLLKIWRRRAGLAAPLAKKNWRVLLEETPIAFEPSHLCKHFVNTLARSDKKSGKKTQTFLKKSATFLSIPYLLSRESIRVPAR